MSDEDGVSRVNDVEMQKILEELLAKDVTITAREVARLHPKIKAASSITRHTGRRLLLEGYQARQNEYRGWSTKLAKQSKANMAAMLADKDIRIAELEGQVELLIASHVAMIRAVGELGGFKKWLQFFEGYRELIVKLETLGALTKADIILVSPKKN